MDNKLVPPEIAAERALLVRQLSLAAERDLRPYFDARWFITASRKDPDLEVLPVWLPEPDWPKSFIAS